MEHVNQLRALLDAVVTNGIRAYIGLLCAGEQERSRRVLSDTMQLSSLASGGPSKSLPVSLLAEEGAGLAGGSTLARVLAYFTIRSLLASLLVLRATSYWSRVPELHLLQLACGELSRYLGDGITGDREDENGAGCRADGGRPHAPNQPESAAVSVR